MSLTIHKEELDQRQLAMTIEVPEERVDKEMRRLAKQLAKNIRIPGFRPGRAPYQVILKRFGKEGVRAQAVEEMLNNVLVEALDQEKIEPYARPTLDEMELEPTVVKLTVPLAPEVTLGDFRSERKEIEPIEVTDAAVDEALERFRQSKATTEEVERPAAEGDSVKLVGKGEIVPLEGEDEEGDINANNVLFDTEEGIDFILDKNTTFAETNFVDEIIGMSVGDEKSFTITYPEDYEVSDFAGRQAKFDLELISIENRTVPELDDELIQEAGFEDLDEMKAKYREDLVRQAEEGQKSETLEAWIDTLHESAELDYPPAAIEQELDEALEKLKEQVKSYQWEWADYLASQETTEAEIRETWREDTVRNFERSLVLSKFIEAERLKISDEELEAHVDKQLERFSDMEMDDNMRQAMRQMFLGQDGIQRVANEIMVNKAFDRIKLILEGNAPDLDALEAEEAAAAEAAKLERENPLLAPDDQDEETEAQGDDAADEKVAENPAVESEDDAEEEETKEEEAAE